MRKGLVLCLIGVSMSLILLSMIPPQQDSQENAQPAAANLTADQLWITYTLPVLETLPTTLQNHSWNTEVVEGRTLTISNVSFTSLNFYGASGGNLTMRGYIVYPDNTSGRLAGPVPGAVLLHGIFQSTNDTLQWAKQFAIRDYIVLCYDHPGHGRSDGPNPNSTNFFSPSQVGHYNETSHLYLSNCAALQAIRIIREQAGVNQSQIVVGGISYGGTNAMIVSGIYHDKVNATIDWIAAGDLPSSWLEDGKLIRYVLGAPTVEALAAYEELKDVWDPLSYVKQTTFPPMLLLCGTNDEFSVLQAFNTTYAAISDNFYSAISIAPNGRHEYIRSYPAQFYWLNATLSGGPAVPRASLNPVSIVNEWSGQGATVSFTISQSADQVSKVEVVYAHLDLVGPYWHTIEVNPSQPNHYSVVLPSHPLNLRVGFFLRITTTSGAVFTTPVYQVSLTTWLTPLAWIGICVGVAGSVLLYAWRRKKNLAMAERTLNSHVISLTRRKTSLDYALVSLHATCLILILYLPWANLGDGCSITGLFLFNNYAPPLGETLAPAVIALTVISVTLAFWFPFIGLLSDGLLIFLFSILWPTLLKSLESFQDYFGAIVVGPALVVMWVSLGLSIFAGVFRLLYWHPVKRAIKKAKLLISEHGKYTKRTN